MVVRTGMYRFFTIVGLATAAAAVSVPAAQNRARILPISAPRAIDTSENALLLTNMAAEDSLNKVFRIRHLGAGGWEEGPTAAGLSFWHPQEILVDRSGRIYVADRDNRRIVRMDDIAGNGWIDFRGTGGNELAGPGSVNGVSSTTGVYGIAFDSAERLHISAFNPLRLIRVDDMTGRGWRTFEPTGGDFISARGVAVDRQDRIYLTDNQHHRIVRINDISGAGLTTLGRLGTGTGQFNQPNNIAIDAAGRIYVADEDNDRIVRMNDMTGAGWTSFGTYGSGTGNLRQPHSIAIDSENRIWINDTGNRRIVRIDSMAGDGWVTFGTRELQGRGLNLGASKYVQVIGSGPTVSYHSVYPHVSVGSGVRTSMIAVNLTSVGVETDVSFGRTPGSNSPCAGDASDCGTPFSVSVGGTTSSRFTRNVGALGTIRLDATTSGASTLAYGRMRSSGAAAGTALLQALSGTTITSEAAIEAASPEKHFMVYVDNRDGAQTAYTITNAAPEGPSLPFMNWAPLIAVLRNSLGEILDRRSVMIPPGGQLSEMVSQAFPAAGSGFEGTVEFNSNPVELQFEAVALRYENGGTDIFTALPVIVDLGNPATDYPPPGAGHTHLPRDQTTTLYYPHVGDGDSYRTNFFLVNTSDTPTVARLDFLGVDGAALALPIDGTFRDSYSVALPPHGTVSVITQGTSSGIRWGWTRVRADQHIDGSAILQRVVNGRIAAETAVPPSKLAPHLVTYVDNRGTTDSGMAVSNPNSALVTVTFNLRNAAGEIVDSTTTTIPPLGYVAQFVRQLFPGAGAVEGTLDVQTPGASVAAVGIRYANQDGTVFTSMPASRMP